MYYSPLGNQRFLLLPFKLYRQPVCKILNNEYRNRLMEDLHKLQDECELPFSANNTVDLCDLMPLVSLWLNLTQSKGALIRRNRNPSPIKKELIQKCCFRVITLATTIHLTCHYIAVLYQQVDIELFFCFTRKRKKFLVKVSSFLHCSRESDKCFFLTGVST